MAISTSGKEAVSALAEPPSRTWRIPARPLKVIRNAHADDIHALIKDPSGAFLSGSKDTSIKKWSHEGELEWEMASRGGYPYWVTALAVFDDGKWVSGSRDGRMRLSEANGESVREWNCSMLPGQHLCKERNYVRINCITALPLSSLGRRFFTGMPTSILFWNLEEGDAPFHQKVSKNDWVYCIEPLINERLAIVTGSDLSLWSFQEEARQCILEKRLIQDRTRYSYGEQRPHISSLICLKTDPGKLAMAAFDGSVRVYDLMRQEICNSYREHEGRAWSVVSLNDKILASGADDRTIKLWDLREKQSVGLLKGHPGRVSSLLALEENLLLAGSCPDRIRAAGDKGCITYWDFRRVESSSSCSAAS